MAFFLTLRYGWYNEEMWNSRRFIAGCEQMQPIKDFDYAEHKTEKLPFWPLAVDVRGSCTRLVGTQKAMMTSRSRSQVV